MGLHAICPIHAPYPLHLFKAHRHRHTTYVDELKSIDTDSQTVENWNEIICLNGLTVLLVYLSFFFCFIDQMLHISPLTLFALTYHCRDIGHAICRLVVTVTGIVCTNGDGQFLFFFLYVAFWSPIYIVAYAMHYWAVTCFCWAVLIIALDACICTERRLVWESKAIIN